MENRPNFEKGKHMVQGKVIREGRKQQQEDARDFFYIRGVFLSDKEGYGVKCLQFDYVICQYGNVSIS